MSFFALPKRLRQQGILGMNSRNANYVQHYNARRFYPNADSKLKTKRIALEANIPVPELLGVISSVGHFRPAIEKLRSQESFVVKPDHGSGGEGVLVLTRDSESRLIRSSGEIVSLEQLRMHVADIVSGLYSLGGQPDVAMIEAKVEFDPVFEKITYRGVPDIRIVALLGIPALAMLRLPTKRSSGRANLHQGAIGVGIDIATGLTRGGIQATKEISNHPDTGANIQGLAIPHWDQILEIACRSCELFKLNYLGIDIVIDKNRGPLVLEVNVRPGLAVQLANQTGLQKRLTLIKRRHKDLSTPEERVAFAKKAVSRVR